MRRFLKLCAFIAIVTVARGAMAQTLGTISFPNSGKSAAQAPFIRGVLLMHSFEYATAAEAFREAQRLDPDFALAWWGEAMTHTHPVWNQQDAAAARAVLGRLAATPQARRAKAGTPREQLYMDAVEALYGAGSKEKRDTLFAGAMEAIAKAHPDDDEAKAFHALALLGLNQGVRDVPTYMRAGAIAQDLLRRNPDHPGAAHYTIHAFDDPIHASLGLHAARLYSKIAPSAPHAQHMTTHIFVAMGMWDDVVSQNVIASGHDHEHWRAGHYTSWLGYGYLQQGRFDEARKHLEHVRANAGAAPGGGERNYLVHMRAQYIVNTERWTEPAAAWELGTANLLPLAAAIDVFATSYAALKAGQRAGAEAGLVRLQRLGGSGVPAVLERQLRALLRLADGGQDEAIALLREAARAEDAIPMEFGPPDIVKPSHELLGEVLLALGKHAEAQREFMLALRLGPGRARSLLGLARAAAAAGDRDAARRAVDDLKRNWHSADANLPELAELQRLLASL